MIPTQDRITACQWLINYYEQKLWEADVFYDDEQMEIMTEYYNGQIDKYKQELVLLQAQLQLE